MACLIHSVEALCEETLKAANFSLDDLVDGGFGWEETVVGFLANAAAEGVRVSNLSLWADVSQALDNAVA